MNPLVVIAVLLALLLVCGVGILGYVGSRMSALPAGNPAEVLASGPPPETPPVLVFLGDSLMLGTLGADWVGALRERLGGAARIVNAGVGGQVTWDLRQRLDAVRQCRPAAVVLLVGSNDAVGALGGQWASFYAQGRPQAPSEDWFAAQYDALVAELSETTRVVCLTLPPLGEDPNHTAQGIVERQNASIRAVAERHGADLLDVHAAMLRALEGTASKRTPFLSGMAAFMTNSIGSIVRNGLLGQSWDRIAVSRGLVLTSDTIHPSGRGGQILIDLVEPWARAALSTGASADP